MKRKDERNQACKYTFFKIKAPFFECIFSASVIAALLYFYFSSITKIEEEQMSGCGGDDVTAGRMGGIRARRMGEVRWKASANRRQGSQPSLGLGNQRTDLWADLPLLLHAA